MELTHHDKLLSFAHERIRPYLEIYTDGTPLPEPYFETFRIATTLLAGAINKPSWTQIIIGKSPLTISTGKNNELAFRFGPDVWGHAWHGVIFLDVEKLLTDSDLARTVAILEELVHSMMSVSDEPLTKMIVARLFPAVVVRDGNYEVAEEYRLRPE